MYRPASRTAYEGDKKEAVEVSVFGFASCKSCQDVSEVLWGAEYYWYQYSLEVGLPETNLRVPSN